MSGSRREKIISAYWYDKRCTCTGWEKIIVHHLGRLTTMGNKREVHTLQILLKQVKSCHFSTEDLTMTYKVLQSLLQPLSLSWVQVLAPCPWIIAFQTHRSPVSRTPQALSYLKDFAFALLSGMRSILQLSKRSLSSLLLALWSKVREACHVCPP